MPRWFAAGFLLNTSNNRKGPNDSAAFAGRVLLALLVVLFSGLLSTAADAAKQRTVKFGADTETNFANPERGFFSQEYPLWRDGARLSQTVESLRALRDDGVSLVRWYLLIDELRDVDAVPEDLLEFLVEQFDNARQAGVKVIPRFAYNFPEGGTFPYDDPDAPLSRVVSHLEQLKPFLNQSADVIAFMEVGLIGAWGEWHSSTNVLIDPSTGVNSATREVVAKVLEVLPTTRMVAIRVPRYKQQLYGPDALTEKEAFTRSDKARVGSHNDCLFASETDWGTYSEDPVEREAIKTYLGLDNRFVPQGGETCNDGEAATPYIQCTHALAELRRLRYSALNIDYHEGVLNLWRTENCFDTVAKNLGYRFRAVSLKLPKTHRRKKLLKMELVIRNDGFTSPYNPRLMEVIFRHKAKTHIIHRFTLKHNPRLWLPEKGNIKLPISVKLPKNTNPGTYEIYLHLPDPEPTLYGNPDYSIRMANPGLWRPESGYNYLTGVTVKK